MNRLSLILVFTAAATLVLGGRVWHLTGLRSILLNTIFGGVALLFAAYQAAFAIDSPWILTIPFVVMMMFAGRALGTWWCSRREATWKRPAQLLTMVAFLAGMAILAASQSR